MKLTRKQAKPILEKTFPEYNGRKISIEFTDHLTFYDTNWSGGTRNKYKFLRTDGSLAILSAPAPWVNPYEGLKADLPLGVLVVCHTIFCGQDCGITIYANPAYAPKWLTA